MLGIRYDGGMRRLAVLLVLCCGATTGQAALAPLADAADLVDLSLDDLLRVEVVGAARYAQPLSETPATATVIGEEELRRQGYRTLGEALASVRGVYTSNDRNYTYLGVRGFNRPGDYNSRVLLLTDGARRNDALFDQAQIGHEAPVEIDWLKRLEFVSGPASALYGANALFGIVNAVLLDGGDVNGTRVTLDAGSGRSRRLGVVAGQRLADGADWFFGFAAYGAQGRDLHFGEFESEASDGWARGLDGEKYQKAYARLRLGDWRLTGSFSSRDKDIPNASFETRFGEPGTRTLDQHGLVELAYDGALNGDWRQQARLFSGSYRYNGDYRYAQGDNRDQGRANWQGADYRLVFTGLAAHKLVLGAETQANTRLLQRNYDVSPYRAVLDRDHPAHTFGFFVQDEWRFHPRWLLNLGARYDKHGDFAAVLSPRAALIFQPNERLSLKAMAGSAHRPPNAYERFYDDGGVLQKANPDLKAERMRSSELSADWRYGAGGRLGVSLYRNDMRDMIDQVVDPADGLLVFANQARVRAQGLEIDAEQRWASGYRLRGSVAWQRSRLPGGETLGNSPQRLGKLVFGVPLAAGWTAAGEWLALSQRRTLRGTSAGYGVLNLVVSSGRLAGLGEFSFGIYNLGDRAYADPASSAFVQDALVQDGRQFRLRWTMAL